MKIAYLFLTIDNFMLPDIWKKYFKKNNDHNIYIHPKYNYWYNNNENRLNKTWN